MTKSALVCSFCNQAIIPPKKGVKSKSTNMIICEDCVASCRKSLDRAVFSALPAYFELDDHTMMVPTQIKEELDKYVIGQDDAKIALSIAVYNHYKMLDIKSDVKISKSNVLMIGPTGSGKTLLAQTIARILDVPFAIADCTSLTEAGYVGDDVESVLGKLLRAAGGNLRSAEHGIVFLDEIDKLAASDLGRGLTKDPSGTGVQHALLKLIEGTTASVPLHGSRKNPLEPGVEMNTEKILFICGGAFPGLEKIVARRTSSQDKSIGFGANVEKREESSAETMKKVEPEDLAKYGIIPELTGRLPVIVTLDDLNEDTMVDILVKPRNSLVNQYRELMKYDGVDLEFTDNALREIARETLKKKTGARGLRSIIEGTLREPMFSLPREDHTGKRRCIVKGINSVQLETEEVREAAY